VQQVSARGFKMIEITRPIRTVALLLCWLAFGLVSPAWSALDASQVLILVNRDAPLSGHVAQMYQRLREVPASNILRLAMGTSQQLTVEQYWSKAGEPVRKYLEDHAEIRCIVTTSGVPYTVEGNDTSDNGAAFDNVLAMVLRDEPGGRKRRQPNPLYLNGMNSYGISDPRLLKMVFVVRLDGPDLGTITRMVEDAIATEKSGLSGMVAGDAQGIDGVTGYGEGDATIRAVVDRLGGAGFPINLDMKQETWKQPASGPGDQAAGAAFYVGWYALLNFQNVFGAQGLAPGSIAWHIASQEAQDIWDPKGNGWCINLMRHGAAVTLGPVREPFVAAFPHGDVFVEALLNGLTVAQAYWLALPQASWAMVMLGDPLYRPFGRHPRASLVARAYVSTGPNQILVRGETSPLLVEIECVGVQGTGTPPLTATVEPEMGLKAASGPVPIPSLRAGETAVVRIPSVTAGDDPTGMFRLQLNTRGSGDVPRHIVLEGRIGFSRLTGGIGPKRQLIVNPDGSSLITGQPGRNVIIQTDSLRSQAVRLPDGFVLSDVAYAPGGAHLAMALSNPQSKEGVVVVADAGLGSTQALPAKTEFKRWLDADRVLLVGENGLIGHSIVAGGADQDLGRPISKAGNVIPGTEFQFYLSETGHVMVKKGSAEPYHEVLPGANVKQFIAVANDLSLFGGVDAEKKLWVQRGLDGKPEMIAAGVANVLWGPISRRAVVWDANHSARVYDGRDGSWKDLGAVAEAQWSDDEESLLFVEARPGTDSNFLSLLSGKLVEQLCPMGRIGQIQKMIFSEDNRRAFLLASLGGGMDAWMMPLPPRVPAPPKASK